MNGKKKTSSLILVACVHAVNHALFNMLTPLAITLMKSFGYNNVAPIALGFTLYLAFYGFAQIPLGFLSDRMSRRTMLGAGLILNGLAIAMAGVSTEYTHFLIAMAAAGLGGATYHPVGAAYLSELYADRKGSALGISGIGATIGLTFGPIIGGRLNMAFGWRPTFIFFAALAVVLGAAFIKFAAEPPREEFKDGSRASSLWNPALAVVLIIAAAVFTFREFAGWGVYFLVPVFTEMIYGFNTVRSGLAGGLISALGFISQPLGGWLSDRFGRKHLMAGFLFLTAIFLVAIPYSGEKFLFPAILLYGFTYSATVPIIDALIADRTPSRIRGGVLGIFMASGIGISAFSPRVMGNIIDTHNAAFSGFSLSFTILAGCVLVSMIIMLLFKNADAPRSNK
ncbi:MAG TPA: MFS transporter [bacterium]|nr:MFS transporter [bacterium]